MSDILNEKVDLSALNLGSFTLSALLGAVVTFCICVIAMRLILSLLRRMLDKTRLDATLRKYALGAVRLVLWVIIVLIVADQLGIPVTSLVALLSVVSLAVSLAVQSVLSNIAGGLVILVTKPFQLGDLVETADGLGTVKEISLTFTKLETPDGLWLMTPNSVLSSGKITNYTALGRRRAEIRVGASYDAAVSDVRAACLDAAARVPGVLPDPAPIVYVDSYGESSISYIVRVWCRSEDYTDVYYGLTEGLKAAFDEHGVEMPYNHLNKRRNKRYDLFHSGRRAHRLDRQPPDGREEGTDALSHSGRGRLGGGQFPRRGDRHRRAQLDRRDPDRRGRRVRRDSTVQMAV